MPPSPLLAVAVYALVITIPSAAQTPQIDPPFAFHSGSYAKADPASTALTHWSIVTVFGRDLADFEEVSSGDRLPTRVRDVRVEVAVPGLTVPAALIYVSPHKVNVHLPGFSRRPRDTGPDYRVAKLRILRGNLVSNEIDLPLQRRPRFGFFTLDGSGSGAAMAEQADRHEHFQNVRRTVRFNGKDNPARGGQAVAFYFTGAAYYGEFAAQAGSVDLAVFRAFDLQLGIEATLGDLSASPLRAYWQTTRFPGIQLAVIELPRDVPASCALQVRFLPWSTVDPSVMPVVQNLTISTARPGETCDGKPLPSPN
jgi:uncharacterized protein (TIGR03437 family)